MDLLVPDSVSPITIKDYLRRHIGFSLTIWRKIKHSGTLLVNKQKVSLNHIVYPNDTITVTWSQECTLQPTKMPLHISYEDEYLLVINKPAGMLMHPTTSEHSSTLGNGLMYYFQKNEMPYGFHPVHRLDRNTSGLVLIAKFPHIQHLLSLNDIKNINRQYLAFVSGIPLFDEGTIDAPIARHPDSIIERRVDKNGQPAVTNYKVVTKFKEASLVELALLTGRTHQIRVHLSSLGHPLLGDDLYGGSREMIDRQALHAARLYFTHPVSGETIDVSSPLPMDLLELMDKLRKV